MAAEFGIFSFVNDAHAAGAEVLYDAVVGYGLTNQIGVRGAKQEILHQGLRGIGPYHGQPGVAVVNRPLHIENLPMGQPVQS